MTKKELHALSVHLSGTVLRHWFEAPTTSFNRDYFTKGKQQNKDLVKKVFDILSIHLPPQEEPPK